LSSIGYHDISQLWKDELEIDNIEQLVGELYEEIKPLYIQVGSFALLVRCHLTVSLVEVEK